jgi:mono/diheme cytochrome c family protein
MSKKTFVIFGLLVVFLAVLIPWLAFRADGDSPEGADVPASLESGKTLFQDNCGNCHTLYAAETDGNFGPDLDELELTEGRVFSAIENGVDGTTTQGRMPPGILSAPQAKEVSEFVAAVAGEG